MDIFDDSLKCDDTRSEQSTTDSLVLAELWQRCGAGIVDYVLVLITIGLMPTPTFGWHSRFLNLFLIWHWCYSAFFAGVVLVLMALILWQWGATPGMMGFAIRVVDATTVTRPTLWRCLIRTFGVWLSAIPFHGLVFLWALFNRRRQALHDLLANTLVVQTASCSKDFSLTSLLSRRNWQAGEGIARYFPDAEHADEEHTSTAGTASPAMDPLYLKAKRVNDGMHRFHTYGKVFAYFSVGFALWINDVAERWVAWQCAVVDDWTQGVLGRGWTALTTLGGSTDPAVNPISPYYRYYNSITSVVTLIGIAWVSRWFFWSFLMRIIEKDGRYQAGTIPRLFGFVACAWAVEYACAGTLARTVNTLLGDSCPFDIPWIPGTFALLLACVGGVTIVWLDQRNSSVGE